ncbi:shikimate kinase AroK [Buchnera aphidicola]|uniref:Shikimate kinase 1 n=1 Tax=Buchnera aphidicola (Sarucallis kahawaluokalani) TaxID=1241878 RepID=A0A4D6Y894_9GAMM|nr:shikimate kinase AroK [Buchnera aphidicola]QCI26146.1 shikimate kinase AroK [Buchnera aphidicola (Sarucallis kahawaluokalani)]
MVAKRNIFLIGPMGAGKSTVGLQLSKELGMSFYDSDNEIEKRTGVDISWVFDVEGESGFRLREEKVINELTQMHKIVLATGGGSILSKNIRNILAARGTIIYLKVAIEKQLLRTNRSKHRPLLNTAESSEMVLKRLAKIRNPLYDEISDITINTNNKHARSIVSYIIQTLTKI